MEQDTGTPAVAAPTSDDAGLSPTFDAGTQSTGSGPEASTGTDEDVTSLREQIAELNKRVSHGTKTYQELQQIRAALKDKEEMLDYWKANGVDPDEINRALKTAKGEAVQAPSQQVPKGVMTTDEFNQHMVLRDWAAEKRAWFKQNPDFKTKAADAIFDGAAKDKAQAEIAEFGRIISSPDEIFVHAVKEFNKFQSVLEKKVSARLTEKRTEVGKQGITETAHQKIKVDRSESEYTPKTPQERAAAFRERQQKVQRGG